MTRRRAARRGRPYQPLPPRRSHWVARLHEPYGDGTYHGKLLKRTRKQLRSVSNREALTTPFLLLGALAFAIGR